LVGRFFPTAPVTYKVVSLCFNGHFPGGPGLASTKMCPFWILLEPRMMAVMVTTGAIRCANSSQIVTTNKPTPLSVEIKPVSAG